MAPRLWIACMTALTLSTSCSALSKDKTGKELASTGPTVITARSNPKTIELNRNLQSNGPAEIVADIKDFTSNVTDVKVRFVRVPMEITMTHVRGTTWKAELSPQQLKTLAVAGETMSYEANIVARDKAGAIGVSSEPVDVVVRTPELIEKRG